MTVNTKLQYLLTLTQLIATDGETLKMLEASYEVRKDLDFVAGQIDCAQVSSELL